MEEKREGAPAPTVQSVTTGAPDAPTLVVGPSDGAGGVSLPSGDTPWGPMGALGDRLYAPELLRKMLSAAVDVWRIISCGDDASLEPLLDSVEALVRLGLLPGRAESEPQDLVVISKVELDALRSQTGGSKLMTQDLARAMEERESFRQQAERLAAELAGLLPEPMPPSRRTVGFRELAEQRMERIMALHEALAKVYAAARPDLDDDSTDALDMVRHLKDGELGAFADELCEWLHDLAFGAATQSKAGAAGDSITFEEVCADPRVDDSGEVTADPRMIRADEILSVGSFTRGMTIPERLAVQADRALAYEVLCTRLGFTESAAELWPVDRVTDHLRDQGRELEAERARADAAVERGKRWRDEVLHAQEQVAIERAEAEKARTEERSAKHSRRRFVEMLADVLAEVFSATEPSSSEGLFAALMGALDPRVEVVAPALEVLRLERKTSREFAQEALRRESAVRARLGTVIDESFGPFPPMSRVVLDDLVSFVERALQVARREPDRMTEACEKLWRATAGRVTSRLVVDTADVDVDGATRT